MHERLERFRRKLAATADPEERADLEAAIAALEEKLVSSAPVETPPASAGDTISVGNLPQATGIAIGAGASARVYIDGRQGKTNDELLAAYYRRLATRCQAMPLEGVYEQRATHDSLVVSIERVYTELATTATTERERLAGDALARFDAAAFLKQHSGAALLPAVQRTVVHVLKESLPLNAPQAVHRGANLAAFDHNTFQQYLEQNGVSVEGMDANALASSVQNASAVTFLGPQLVSEALAAAPRLVLLGEPGSGKSTALRYLAYTLASAGLDPAFDLTARLMGWSPGRLVPVFAPLLPLAKRFADDPTRRGDAEDLWDYLVDHLQPKGANAGLAAAVHEEVEAGRVLLLLDGLDEVAGAESRRKVVRAVRSFAARYPDCRIVVACRVRAYEGARNAAWQLPGWPTATLADWTLGQMQSFVRAWYHTVAALRDRTAEWRDDRIAGLARALSTREDLRRFGRQPLMMTVMALVHLNDGRLPEERASLYGRCIDILLGQWESAGKDASEYGTLTEYTGLRDVDAQSLRPLLGKAAYEAHRAAVQGEVGRISRAVLRTLVDDELKRRGHPSPSHGADKFLEYTDLRAGLIQASDAGDAYAFPHQTFQEYLAGIELVAGVEPVARILDLRNDDRWRRPILLGVEQLALSSLDVPYRLLSRLVEEPSRAATQRAFDLLLAHEIADDLGWDWLEQRDALFTALKQRFAQALADTLSETAVPARDLVRAGAALAVVGDPRPDVCDLPPTMVAFAGGDFVIGEWGEALEQAVEQFMEQYRAAGNELSDEQKPLVRELLGGWKDKQPKPLEIAPFELARYPVTNAQYKRFLDAGGYDPQAPWWDDAARQWLTRDDAAMRGLESWQRRGRKNQPGFWDHEDFGIVRPNYPVVGVSWYEASAFCRWLTQLLNDGYVYQLPSEAEWEYAARGQGRRVYPWGNVDPDGERANFNQIYGSTTAVGCFPLGSTTEGVLDLAGNVWEWTRSQYRDYPYDPTDGREDSDKPVQKRFTTRGGSWAALPLNLRAADRNHNSPDAHVVSVGLRLARHPIVVKR